MLSSTSVHLAGELTVTRTVGMCCPGGTHSIPVKPVASKSICPDKVERMETIPARCGRCLMTLFQISFLHLFAIPTTAHVSWGRHWVPDKIPTITGQSRTFISDMCKQLRRCSRWAFLLRDITRNLFSYFVCHLSLGPGVAHECLYHTSQPWNATDVEQWSMLAGGIHYSLTSAAWCVLLVDQSGDIWERLHNCAIFHRSNCVVRPPWSGLSDEHEMQSPWLTCNSFRTALSVGRESWRLRMQESSGFDHRERIRHGRQVTMWCKYGTKILNKIMRIMCQMVFVKRYWMSGLETWWLFPTWKIGGEILSHYPRSVPCISSPIMWSWPELGITTLITGMTAELAF